MLQQSIDELIKKAGNRYALTIIASQRARELIDESAGKPDAFNIQKPLTYATDEILCGKISVGKDAEFDAEDTME
ncbi:MAG: DNA-directed RNA polymerase subunit omega [Bacillota bacterium]|nr:DNA-directed RNA polymerase subunit omega [Bacillota bacterium]